MTFRQQIGPAASAKQVKHLRALLADAGYIDFRSARGPFGLTQRQGLGKFSAAEADVLIEKLEREAEEAGLDGVVLVESARLAPRPLRDIPTDVLVTELRLRGWEATRR